jgi:DNA-binding FadR family transcriptional regulator
VNDDLAPEAIEAVRPASSYELVVDQVRRAIQLGRFGPGDKLPPERELSQQLGVSRTTVREAMRVLQGEGLVEIRRGRSGGAIVSASTSSRSELRRLLRERLAELEAVIDYRLIVEPAAARLAAERRTKRDLVAMQDLVEAMSAVAAASGDSETSPPSRFFTLDSRYHRRIAETTRNDMLVRAVDEARSALFAPVGRVFGELHRDANVLHEEIFEAVVAQDAATAERAMATHIRTTKDALHELTGSRRRRTGS